MVRILYRGDHTRRPQSSVRQQITGLFIFNGGKLGVNIYLLSPILNKDFPILNPQALRVFKRLRHNRYAFIPFPFAKRFQI